MLLPKLQFAWIRLKPPSLPFSSERSREWFLKISEWMMATLMVLVRVWLLAISSCPPFPLHPPGTPSRLPMLTAAGRYGRISFALISGWMVFVIGALLCFVFFSSCRHILMNSGQHEEQKSEAKQILCVCVWGGGAPFWFCTRWLQSALHFPLIPFFFFHQNIRVQFFPFVALSGFSPSDVGGWWCRVGKTTFRRIIMAFWMWCGWVQIIWLHDVKGIKAAFAIRCTVH